MTCFIQIFLYISMCFIWFIYFVQAITLAIFYNIDWTALQFPFCVSWDFFTKNEIWTQLSTTDHLYNFFLTKSHVYKKDLHYPLSFSCLLFFSFEKTTSVQVSKNICFFIFFLSENLIELSSVHYRNVSSLKYFLIILEADCNTSLTFTYLL